MIIKQLGNPKLTRFARLISRVFGPLTIVPLVSIYILIQHTGLSNEGKLPLLLTLTFSSFLIPALYLVTLFRRGLISDLDMTDRKERLTPFLVVLVSQWVGVLVAQLFNPTRLFSALIVLTTIVLSIEVVVTIKEKVSLHASGVMILFFVVNAATEWRHVWLLLFVPLVCWARWYLRKHTVRQLVLGIAIPTVVFLTGFACMLE